MIQVSACIGFRRPVRSSLTAPVLVLYADVTLMNTGGDALVAGRQLVGSLADTIDP